MESFENNAHRTEQIGKFLPKAEIKVYDFIFDDQHFYNQPVKNDVRAYENIRNTATDQGDDCTTGFLLDYLYFKKKQTMKWLQ